MLKELKEARKIIYEHNENISKEIEIIRKSQIEILELKSIVTEIRSSLERFNRRLSREKKQISEHNDRTIEINHIEKQEKKKKESEQNLR